METVQLVSKLVLTCVTVGLTLYLTWFLLYHNQDG
jgi:hypothetical protein